jgi:hypothetical protein
VKGRKRLTLGVVIAAALAATALASASAAASPPALAEPAAVSPACRHETAPHAACGLVIDFFRSVNTEKYGHACSLLGRVLLLQTGGAHCPALLAADGARRYAIRGVSTLRSGTGVLVSVWLPELDHFRELRWLAVVAPEEGLLRILETRRVA